VTKWNEDVATEDFLDGSYDVVDMDPDDDKEWYLQEEKLVEKA
jgi:hypothetical protein